MRSGWFRRVTVVALAAVALAAGGQSPGIARAQAGEVTVEWLGWSFYRLTSPTGKVILLNPWVEGNPDAAVRMEDITRADVILPAQGHPDDQGSAVPLAKQTGARVFVTFELGTWMIDQGVPMAQVMRAGPGSRMTLDGITIRMVNAIHGNGAPGPASATPYGGLSTGFIITFENGWTVYFDGNSAATQDMALWAEAYQPDAMIFNMNGGREPTDAAMAVSLMRTRNPNLSTLLPHHQRVTPPAGATTVTDVRAALDRLGIDIPITDPTRGQIMRFSK